ncbi:MAG: type II secretion system secretin GspD [Methylococcales bacterium]|nr:type II secretion system secretin GspD [Methylococcales bacterium]
MGKKIPLDSLPLQTSTQTNTLILDKEKSAETNAPVAKMPKAEIYPGTGDFISKKALPKKAPQPLRNGKYELNFTNAEIEEVAQTILGEILGLNYVVSPNVRGSITIKTTKPISKSEMLPTLAILLKMNGAALVENNNIYHIEPATLANGFSSIKSGKHLGKLPEGHQILIIPLEYVSVMDMAEVLKGILSEGALIRLDKSRNVMVIAGHGQELEQALGIIKTFDVNVMEGMSFGIFPLQQAAPETVIKELEFMLESGEQTPLNGLLRFVAIERLNAIMAISPQARYLTTVKHWVNRLDKANTSSNNNGIIVYKVKHVDAEELASTLSTIITGVKSKPKKDKSLAPGVKSGRIGKKKTLSNQSNRLTNSRSNLRGSSNATGSIDQLEGVNIVADPTNNALIIIATPSQYKMLKDVIVQLDVMPLQVLIDATIISVTLSDELRHGIRWYFTHKNGGASSGSGIGLTDIAQLAATAFNPGFGYSFVSSADNIRAVLTAEAKDNKINVISAPSIMVLNNQEAVIQVGEKIPVRTSELTTDTGATSNTIQMRETGVTLKVKPRVNANGLVIMTIDQSVDNAIPAGSDGSTSAIDSPSILQRKITSIVAVHDRETIVLGGLISENKTYDKTGIPLLNQIPVLGALFGSTEKTITKTELVILITPRVIRTRAAAREIALEFKQKLTGIFEESLPLNEN